VDALQSALGVARVARVTGLDRFGVEVACAVRPLGHVLQVCNGKGETWEQARASALSEAVQRLEAGFAHTLLPIAAAADARALDLAPMAVARTGVRILRLLTAAVTGVEPSPRSHVRHASMLVGTSGSALSGPMLSSMLALCHRSSRAW